MNLLNVCTRQFTLFVLAFALCLCTRQSSLAQGPWLESWQGSVPGTYPSSTRAAVQIRGDCGTWYLVDPFAQAVPSPNSAEILMSGTNRMIKLNSRASPDGSSPNDLALFMAIPAGISVQ